MIPECSHQQQHHLSPKGHLAVCPTFIPADHAPPLQPKTRTHMVTPTGMETSGSGFYWEIISGCSSGSHGCTRQLRFPSFRHFYNSCVLDFVCVTVYLDVEHKNVVVKNVNLFSNILLGCILWTAHCSNKHLFVCPPTYLTCPSLLKQLIVNS